MTTPAKLPKDVKAKPTNRDKIKALKMLPVTAEDLRDPQKFSYWIYANSPLMLQGIFDLLPHASPNESLKVLASLFETAINFRPFIAQQLPTAGVNDPAEELAKLLRTTEEFTEKE